MDTDKLPPEDVPRWLEQVRLVTLRVELCGWYVFLALFPWIVVFTMLGVVVGVVFGAVPWIGVAPCLGTGLACWVHQRRNAVQGG
jgi:hypothetical protein